MGQLKRDGVSCRGAAVIHRYQTPSSSAFSQVALQSIFRPSASTQDLCSVLKLPASLTAHWWISLFILPTDGPCGTLQLLIARASQWIPFIIMCILLLVFLWWTLPYTRSQSLGQVSQLVQCYLAVWAKTRVWTVVILTLGPRVFSNVFLDSSHGLYFWMLIVKNELRMVSLKLYSVKYKIE